MRGLIVIDAESFQDQNIRNFLLQYFRLQEQHFLLGLLYEHESNMLPFYVDTFTRRTKNRVYLIKNQGDFQHSVRLFCMQHPAYFTDLDNIATFLVSKNPTMLSAIATPKCTLLTPVFNRNGELLDQHVTAFENKLARFLDAESAKKKDLQIVVDLDETLIFTHQSVAADKTILNRHVLSFLKKRIAHEALNTNIIFLTARKKHSYDYGGSASINAILTAFYEAMDRSEAFHPDKMAVYHGENKYEILCNLYGLKKNTMVVLLDDNPEWTRAFDQHPREHISYISVHSTCLKTGMPLLAFEALNQWAQQITPIKIKSVSASAMVSRSSFYGPKQQPNPKSVVEKVLPAHADTDTDTDSDDCCSCF